LIEKVPYRIVMAIAVVLIAVFAMALGVGFTERDLKPHGGVLEYTYYALSLFVIGGVDLGTPQGGPIWARAGLWIAYFAAPVLTVSAILDAIFRVFSTEKFRLRHARNHIVIVGDEKLAEMLLRRLREFDTRALVVLVVDSSVSQYRLAQLRKQYGVLALVSDVIDDYVFERISIRRASRVLILGEESLSGFGLAHTMLQRNPALAGNITVHCMKLRFMRAMGTTSQGGAINTFNTYQLAARRMVEQEIEPLLDKQHDSAVIVLAGFGPFGQSILERLQDTAAGRIEAIAVLSDDVERRLLVTREQVAISTEIELHSFQGDISHPQVWSDLNDELPIDSPRNIFVMSTDRSEDNLRTALWLRRQTNAAIIARTRDALPFVREVGVHDDIAVVNTLELAGYAIPRDWLLAKAGAGGAMPPREELSSLN